MFYGHSIEDTRQMFYLSWQKYKQKQSLEPLEQQLVQVIIDHPEYQPLFEDSQRLTKQYLPEFGEANPFMHLGLHLAIRDQLSTNRPVGISEIFTKALHKYGNPLAVEHQMMDVLAEALWQAQRNNQFPDEETYLRSIVEKLG